MRTDRMMTAEAGKGFLLGLALALAACALVIASSLR